MALLELKPLCPDYPLEQSRRDYRAAKRLGPYRVSEQAFYFPAFPTNSYLSFDAVLRAWTQKTSLPLTGCCGKELPMVMLRVEYEGGFYQNFTFETQDLADAALARLQKARPELFAAEAEAAATPQV
ncbi:MAG: hypothetical protein RRY97_07935 [Oscillibacter sp.]